MSRNQRKHKQNRIAQVAQTGRQQALQGQKPQQSRTPQQKSLERMATEVGQELRSDVEAAAKTMSNVGRAAMDTIRRNPAPIALAGIGVACAGAGITWLLMSGGKRAMSSGGAESMQQGRGNGAQRAESLKRTLKHATEVAGTKASALAHEAAVQGRKLESSFEETVQAHPLAMGAAMLAVGTAIGLAIPRTALEDGFLGRERDKLMSAAQRAARGAAKKVESFARHVGENSVAQA
jgi:hypothetical protein